MVVLVVFVLVVFTMVTVVVFWRRMMVVLHVHDVHHASARRRRGLDPAADGAKGNAQQRHGAG